MVGGSGAMGGIVSLGPSPCWAPPSSAWPRIAPAKRARSMREMTHNVIPRGTQTTHPGRPTESHPFTSRMARPDSWARPSRWPARPAQMA